MYGCKNAVKSGDKLSEIEVISLLEKAHRLHNASFCPHGRPIYYELPASMIDTLCKRK